ncbi:MAG: O-antigen ligase family protein [bacterium]
MSLIETLILLTGLIWSLGRIKITKSLINLPVLFYLLSCLLSTINSYYLRGSLEEITKLASCILLFLVIGNYFSTRLKLLIHTFIFTTLIVICLGISHFFTHLNGSLNDRLFYPLGNPNLLAGFLVITIPLLWSQTLNMGFRNKFHIQGLTLSFLSFITLYLTYSRGGMLGVIGAISFLFFINRQRNNRYISILTPCLLIGIGLLIIYKYVFLSYLAGLSSTAFQRFYIWKCSYQMFLDHPILGVGLGVYPNAYFDYKQDGQWHLHSHNIFIQHACEVGIIGLLSFIWLLITLFKENFGRLLESNYEKAVREGLLASLIGLLIHSQVDYLCWIPVFQLYFWLIVGILSSMRAKEYILLPNPCWFISIIIILFWSFCILKPFLGYVSFNQGVELADKGKWEEAKIKFEKAVLLDFYHPLYHAHLGTTYTKIYPQDKASAIKEYEKATQFDKSKAWMKTSKLKAKKTNTISWKLYRRVPMLVPCQFSCL